MSEHSPAPTPARGVYGFTLYLICRSAFFMYLVWAFVPDYILHYFGITYYPQKYWAIALPTYFLTVFAIFVFLIYPSLNAMLTPSLASLNTMTDKAACPYKEEQSLSGSDGVPTAADLNISDVCKVLYWDKLTPD